MSLCVIIELLDIWKDVKIVTYLFPFAFAFAGFHKQGFLQVINTGDGLSLIVLDQDLQNLFLEPAIKLHSFKNMTIQAHQS